MRKANQKTEHTRTTKPLRSGVRLVIGDADGRISLAIELSRSVHDELSRSGSVTVLRDDVDVDVDPGVMNCEPRVRFLTMSLPGG